MVSSARRREFRLSQDTLEIPLSGPIDLSVVASLCLVFLLDFPIACSIPAAILVYPANQPVCWNRMRLSTTLVVKMAIGAQMHMYLVCETPFIVHVERSDTGARFFVKRLWRRRT